MEQDEFSIIEKLLEQEKIAMFQLVELRDEVSKNLNDSEKKMVLDHIHELKIKITEINSKIPERVNKITLSPEKQNFKPLPRTGIIELSEFEKNSLKRTGNLEKKELKTSLKPSSYLGNANKLFGNLATSTVEKGSFKSLRMNLIKSNLPYMLKGYVALTFFNVFITFCLSFLVFLFLLFFNFFPALPIISLYKGDFLVRFAETFWIIIIFPLLTFIFMYTYPGLEKKSLEHQINQELPFATIHMAAISGAMIEPSKVFKIIINTKEYPNLEREFIKLLNEVNVYGYDLVSALRNVAFHGPSTKLSELLNGIATTISSGGNLSEFFSKRSESLLFEHKLDRERQNKSAETFMDIYISVVVAAPMILMLLVMMISVSGLGLNLGVGIMTFIMILAVAAINAVFLTFLQIKQPTD